MTQNIYDEQAFFAGYSTLPRSVAGLDAAPEWPVLRAKLPQMAGLHVLDLGCGFGWFCRWACEQGAAHVDGLDVSHNMLARARESPADTRLHYRQADLDCVVLPTARYDVAYSSLTLHYLKNLDQLFASVYAALKPGGYFVFSAEHPIFTAPSSPGWLTRADAGNVWPLDNYLREGPRTTDWFAPGVIKQHRTVSTYLNSLIKAGFVLTYIDDWGPNVEQIAEHPEWADEQHRPAFLIVAARKGTAL